MSSVIRQFENALDLLIEGAITKLAPTGEINATDLEEPVQEIVNALRRVTYYWESQIEEPPGG